MGPLGLLRGAVGGWSLASGFRLAQAGEVMALVPEHNLPGLVHAHHVGPRVAPGRGVDSSAEEREGQALGGVRSWACSLVLPSLLDGGSLECSRSPLPHLRNGLKGLW